MPPEVVQHLYNDIDADIAHRGRSEDGLSIVEMNAWLLRKLDLKEQMQQKLRNELRDHGTEILQLFHRWDVNNDASVSLDELCRALEHLNYKASPDTVACLFDELDQDGSGEVALAELSTWLLRKLDSKEQLQQDLRDGLRANGARVVELMDRWDASGDQSIDVKELGHALSSLGYEASTEAVAELFAMLDQDGDGVICLQELNAFLLTKVNSKAQLKMAIRRALKSNGRRVMDLFREWDVDNDALITQAEFNRALVELGFHVSEEMANKIFDELDANSDYKLSFEEVNCWLKEKPQPKPASATALAKLNKPTRVGSRPASRPTSPPQTPTKKPILKGTPTTASLRSFTSSPPTTKRVVVSPPAKRESEKSPRRSRRPASAAANATPPSANDKANLQRKKSPGRGESSPERRNTSPERSSRTPGSAVGRQRVQKSTPGPAAAYGSPQTATRQSRRKPRSLELSESFGEMLI